MPSASAEPQDAPGLASDRVAGTAEYHMIGSFEPEAIRNRILLALPPATLDRIRPELEPIRLTRGKVIDHVDRPIEYLYFVNRGFVSVVKTMLDGRTVEIGGVGIEGITDPYALLGIPTAVLETIVQIPGSAFRVKRGVLKNELERDRALRDILLRYTRFAFGQLAQTAACNGLHSLEERCCRWLLAAHDSAFSDTFPLTHEFLAMMLGVQRSSVSIAARLLMQAGLIEYVRGKMHIADRTGLEEAACECYATSQRELDKLFEL